MKKICLNCAISENEIPLIQLAFDGGHTYICPQCLPSLIHAPHKLADKLPALKDIKPEPHKHK